MPATALPWSHILGFAVLPLVRQLRLCCATILAASRIRDRFLLRQAFATCFRSGGTLDTAELLRPAIASSKK